MKQRCGFVFGLLFLSVFMLGGAVSVSAAVEPDGSVVINEVNFPGEAFRKMVSGSDYDTNQNGILEREEREQKVWMTIDFTAYSYENNDGAPGTKYSCRGIEHFPNIKNLTIHEFDRLQERIAGLSQLESVYVENYQDKKLTMQEITQKLPIGQLKKLSLYNCELEVLDLSEAANLEELAVSRDDEDEIRGKTHVGRINVRKNRNLKVLTLGALDLKKLDLSQNKKIENIQISDMEIPSGVKISELLELRKIVLRKTRAVKSLDLSRHKKLEELEISDAGQLKSLILPKNGRLEKMKLSGGNNHLKKLDLSGQKELKNLSLSNVSGWKTLDLTKNRKLRTLSLSSMINMKKLNLKKNVMLRELSISGNGPKKLDLSKNKKLTDLYLDNPNIRFQLPKKSVLKYLTLDVSHTTIDLSSCTASLVRITNMSYGAGTKLKMNRKVFEKLWNSSDFRLYGSTATPLTKANKKVNIPKKGKYVYVSM